MADTSNPAQLLSTWELVNAAWDRAVATASSAEAKTAEGFANALGEAGAAALMTPAVMSFTPDVVEPLVNIPVNADSVSIANFEGWYERLTDRVADQFGAFLSTYFPNECGYLGHAQQWICDALTLGGTGIHPDIEAQIYGRDRDRIVREGAVAQRELVSSFAARGFPLPPGALAVSLKGVQADTLAKLSESSRERAIKQAELEVENVRFAVDKAITLYSAAVGAAGDYIKSMVSSSGMVTQLLPAQTDSQSKLIGAASEYYRARLGVEELRLKATQPNGEWSQQSKMKNVESIMKAMEMRVNAATEAAKAMAVQASAALNALHASAGLSSQDQLSTSYNYSGEI